MKTALYPYQKTVVNAALEYFQKNQGYAFLLEMSMGKTLCTLTLSEKMNIEKLLIVPPKALYTTWKKEVQKHMEKSNVFFWENDKTKKYKEKIKEFLNSKGLKIFIVNIESFQKPPKTFMDAPLVETLRSFFMLSGKLLMAIDESSKIKGHNSNRTKNIIKVGAKADYRLILTGTEIENTILDLWAQFEFLQKDFWDGRNFFRFRNRYMMMKLIYGAGGRMVEIPDRPNPERLKELQRKINSCSSRLKKVDHLDLPEKIYEEVELEPNTDQIKIYNQLKEDMFTEYQGQLLTPTLKIQLYTQFWQIAGGFMPGTGTMIGKTNPKLEFIIADSEDYPGPVVIWANFRKEIEHLTKSLSGAAPYYGGQDTEEREKILKDFEDGKIKYLIINPGSGSYGLNLQFCSLCYYYSNSNRPGFRRQGEDRFHRPGQKNHPTYKDLLYPALGDKTRLKTLKEKQDFCIAFSDTTNIEEFLKNV